MLKNGVLVYEHYNRTNIETPIHATFSIPKSVAGLIGGILAGQGKLDVTNLVLTYVPEVKGSLHENVTVRQLLAGHTIRCQPR